MIRNKRNISASERIVNYATAYLFVAACGLWGAFLIPGETADAIGVVTFLIGTISGLVLLFCAWTLRKD